MNKIKPIVKKAGALLKKRYFQGTGFSEKERYHLLSETDMEIHEFLSRELKKKIPGYAIASEEDTAIPHPQGSLSHKEEENGLRIKESTGPVTKRIIIDPIDGTTNFITGKPYFTISVAIEAGNSITEAHVYNPLSMEYYFAGVKTDRAVYNSRPIDVSTPVNIEDMIIVVGLSYQPVKIENYIKEWGHLLDRCRKCLFWTAPAQTICNVARGRVSLFVDTGSSMHGQSAASLILKQAGGTMFNYDGSPFDHRIKGGIFMAGGVDVKGVMKYRRI